MSLVPKEIMVFKLNFLSDFRLTMSQASSILYSPATTCSKTWSKTSLTIQITWNIGMNQESNLIKIPKVKFFSRPNVWLTVWLKDQLWPIAKWSFGHILCQIILNIVMNQESNLIRYTDRNNFEDSYKLVKHLPDFTLWEYRIASFIQKLLLKGSTSVLPEREIREMFY